MIRRACITDTGDVCRIGRASYPSALHESEATVESIIASGMSWVCVEDDAVVGYALVHEIKDPHSPPHLNDVLAVWWGGRHLFIHDVCVTPSSRAHGVGKALVKHVLDTKRYDTTTLISLEASVWFWVQFGFEAFECKTTWNFREEYGEGAMQMKLPAGQRNL